MFAVPGEDQLDALVRLVGAGRAQPSDVGQSSPPRDTGTGARGGVEG